jgi:glycosyltransferase involved in cell wall biosynthesis
MQTICLVMMVKNEGAVVERCLASVRGILSHWVVCDTGSTDGTAEVVRSALKGIPGELHSTPWVDFAWNRTQAIRLARDKADYHLVLDADMTLNVHSEFRDKLTADSYYLRYEGDLDYFDPRLVSDRHDWRYLGVTHEYIASETDRSWKKLPHLSITHHCDGGMRGGKFQRDIELLQEALKREPQNARHVFYLAQSYRDMGLLFQAFECYARRAAMGGWDEEVWYSLYQVARLLHLAEMPWSNVSSAYTAAWRFRPSRIEPMFHVAKHHREIGDYGAGMELGRQLLERPYPDDLLFIERSIYEFLLPIEYALCCQGTGRLKEATRAYEGVLTVANLPEKWSDFARKNLAVQQARHGTPYQASLPRAPT